MLMSKNFHMKTSEVSIKTRSTPASLSFKGQATKQATVNGLLCANLFQEPSGFLLQMFSRDVTAALLLSLNKGTAAML